jgi:hypothetical protein
MREENPGRVQERTKHNPFSTGQICMPRAAALSFVSIAHHVSKSDADKNASREQIRQMENALYTSFQAH